MNEHNERRQQISELGDAAAEVCCVFQNSDSSNFWLENINTIKGSVLLKYDFLN
jgi:hypothetical protein